MIESEVRPVGTVRSQHGALWGLLMTRLINPLMAAALSSRRLHAVLGSDTLMVIAFQGRRSGKAYRFPIGYMQQGSSVVCYSPFGWWRNLAGGASVRVTVRGRTLQGVANVCTDVATIEAGLNIYLRHNPGDAKYFEVHLDAQRQPRPGDVARAARRNVQITNTLDHQ
jgi:hypothetical protein